MRKSYKSMYELVDNLKAICVIFKDRKVEFNIPFINFQKGSCKPSMDSEYIVVVFKPKFGNVVNKDISSWDCTITHQANWFYLLSDKERERYVKEAFIKIINAIYEAGVVEILGYPWTTVKDGNYTYYFMLGMSGSFIFSRGSLDYHESYIREKVCSELSKGLQNIFGSKLSTLEIDLNTVSSVGESFPTIVADYVGVMSLDIVKKFLCKIPKVGGKYWIANPESDKYSCYVDDSNIGDVKKLEESISNDNSKDNRALWGILEGQEPNICLKREVVDYELRTKRKVEYNPGIRPYFRVRNDNYKEDLSDVVVPHTSIINKDTFEEWNVLDVKPLRGSQCGILINVLSGISEFLIGLGFTRNAWCLYEVNGWVIVSNGEDSFSLNKESFSVEKSLVFKSVEDEVLEKVIVDTITTLNDKVPLNIKKILFPVFGVRYAYMRESKDEYGSVEIDLRIGRNKDIIAYFEKRAEERYDSLNRLYICFYNCDTFKYYFIEEKLIEKRYLVSEVLHLFGIKDIPLSFFKSQVSIQLGFLYGEDFHKKYPNIMALVTKDIDIAKEFIANMMINYDKGVCIDNEEDFMRVVEGLNTMSSVDFVIAEEDNIAKDIFMY